MYREIIGHCGLRYVDQKEEEVEIMYLLDPEFWGRVMQQKLQKHLYNMPLTRWKLKTDCEN